MNRNLVRTCGRCQITLNKKNTGPLQWLQPDCNDCTEKFPPEKPKFVSCAACVGEGKLWPIGTLGYDRCKICEGRGYIQ